jgi:hypothetical protein
MEEGEKAYYRTKQVEQDSLTDAISREMADHTRIIQKPIGVVTEKEIHKGKTPTRDTSNARLVSGD